MDHQIRILSAALMLERFTASDLAAQSGVVVETVRSVIRRDEERNGEQSTYVRDGAQSAGEPGRPRLVYVLRDPDAVRERLSNLAPSERPDGGDPLALPVHGQLEPADRQRALIAVAESALDAAWRAAGGDRADALDSAQEAAMSVLSPGVSVDVRARAQQVLTSIETMRTAALVDELRARLDEREAVNAERVIAPFRSKPKIGVFLDHYEDRPEEFDNVTHLRSA